MHIRLSLLLVTQLFAANTAVTGNKSDGDEESRRHTAVALNYCRAALHRIRRNPENRVLVEEQQRILDNLDLNRISDPEVIALYRSVLDEISQIVIGEREQTAINEQFLRDVHRQLGTSFFVVGAQIATGQLGSAIQSGAGSWWDYRHQEVRRNSDLWNVERGEFSGLMGRSSSFLDSFWKLSRSSKLPDRWLLRDQDLDRLALALRESDAKKRLRKLRRMERFMECYPPWWYYVARTEQQLGRLDEALVTYRRLTQLGSGHFRQDDMLAGSLANMALIQEQNGDPEAPVTALRSSNHSTRNWEANLVCAWILGRHHRLREGQSLLLCNLDEGLESIQSSIALVSLYYHSDDARHLADLLSNKQVVASVPIPGLLLCARLLGSEQLPQPAAERLRSTIHAEYRLGRRDAVVFLRAASGWKLNDAQPVVRISGTETSAQSIHSLHEKQVVKFHPKSGVPERGDQRIELILHYPELRPICVTLTATVADGDRWLGRWGVLPFAQDSRIRFVIEDIDVDGVRLSLSSLKQPDAEFQAACSKPVSPNDSVTATITDADCDVGGR